MYIERNQNQKRNILLQKEEHVYSLLCCVPGVCESNNKSEKELSVVPECDK